MAAHHLVLRRTPQDELATRSNARPNRAACDHREVQREREFMIEGTDFDSADNGGQRERYLKHSEMVADARPRTAAEWQVLPTIERLEFLRAEPLGIESMRIFP